MIDFRFCATKMRQRKTINAPMQNSKNAPAHKNLCAM